MEILDDTGAAEALEALLQARAEHQGYVEEEEKAKERHEVARARVTQARHRMDEAETRLCKILDIYRCGH